jgi:hypothetical protein
VLVCSKKKSKVSSRNSTVWAETGQWSSKSVQGS